MAQGMVKRIQDASLNALEGMVKVDGLTLSEAILVVNSTREVLLKFMDEAKSANDLLVTVKQK